MAEAVIDLSRADLGLAEEVAARPGGASLRACFTCGACTAACQVHRQGPDYDPRRIIRLVLLGQREEVLSSPFIWQCATCYSCQEICPMGVRFADLSFVLKNLAVEEGYSPPSLTAQVELLRGHGRLYEITDFENQKRTDLGLPEIREKAADFQVMLADLSGRLAGRAEAESEA